MWEFDWSSLVVAVSAAIFSATFAYRGINWKARPYVISNESCQILTGRPGRPDRIERLISMEDGSSEFQTWEVMITHRAGLQGPRADLVLTSTTKSLPKDK